MIFPVYYFQNDKILMLDFSNLKAFEDDNFKFNENGRESRK